MSTHRPDLLRPARDRSAHVASGLSVAEVEILDDAADGLTMLGSAARRHKSIETVKSQRKSILAKLGARNMTHAVAIATRDGIVSCERAA
jgi:two-component system NarL family response regulator